LDLYYAEKCSIKNTGKNITGHFIKGDAATELMILQDHWQGKLQMIYLDPPFFTGNAFYFKQRIGEKGWEGDTKYIITHQAYSDQWIDRASFVNMLRQVLTLSHKLLKPEGSLFLHLDYRFSPHARLLMDEIFGEENFLNEIIWAYRTGGRAKRHFSRKHDTILFYRKSNQHFFDPEAVGKPRGPLKRNNMKRQKDKDGRIFWSIRSGGKEYRYYEDSIIIPSDVWDDISHLQQKDPERTGYDTQKPESLLERMILSTTRQGDWVGDFFAGSGTTLAVAQKNGRKWLAVDKSVFSMYVSRKRLLQLISEGFFVFSDSSLKITNSSDSSNVLYTVSFSDKNTIKVKLVDYSCKQIPCLSNNFLDYVDFWSVGYINSDRYFVQDYTFRTHTNPFIKQELAIPIIEVKSEIAVHIVDIYGKQSLIIIR